MRIIVFSSSIECKLSILLLSIAIVVNKGKHIMKKNVIHSSFELIELLI